MDQLFRVECFVSGKRLPEVLTALVGKVDHMSCPVPVTNVAKSNGKLVSKTNGSSGDMFITHLADLEAGIHIDAKYVRDFLLSAGHKAHSATTALKAAMSAGLLRRKGKGAGTYYIVRQTKAPS